MMHTISLSKFALSSLCILGLVGCSTPSAGPDKTLGGAVLGAGWGAGTGAIIGNNAGTTAGKGVAVGAGLGLVSGALTGLSQDAIEDTQLEQDKELAALKIQNLANARQLEAIQRTLDNALTGNALAGVYQVFFDNDSSSLRAGSTANLEVITESLKASTSAAIINVVGHSDDASTPEYNERLAEARARAVAAYISSRGVSVDQIKVRSFGSQRPIASNESEVGRQLNRRVDVYISHQ